ncbi:MAG: hypothetical protein M0004_11670 [Actinomycetota bacterium]|nr:hypothetical protein [Actinomycetota bacterium]
MKAGERCAAAREDLFELATGALSGRRRSAVLEHVASCPLCASELAELTAIADGLLSLAPAAEPPVGFEARVAAAWSARAPVARRPRRALWCAAAAGLVALGAIGGWLVSSASTPPPVRTAVLVRANTAVTGTAVVTGAAPARLVMTLSSSRPLGEVRCAVTTRAHRRIVVGSFWMDGPTGAWSATLSVPTDELAAVSVLSSTGAVVASGRLDSAR